MVVPLGLIKQDHTLEHDLVDLTGGFDKNKIVLYYQNKITLRRPQSHLTRKSAKRGVSSSFTGLEKVNLAHKTKQGTINCAILGSRI